MTPAALAGGCRAQDDAQSEEIDCCAAKSAKRTDMDRCSVVSSCYCIGHAAIRPVYTSQQSRISDLNGLPQANTTSTADDDVGFVGSMHAPNGVIALTQVTCWVRIGWWIHLKLTCKAPKI